MKFKRRLLSRVLASTALSTVVLSGSPAQACGGLFCSAANPVNQAAERIIFAKNDDGTVTQIVEIMYEGDAEKFAWVLPVAGKPEPSVSSVQALDRLQNATNPTYVMRTTFDNGCGGFGASSPTLAIAGDGDGDGDGDADSAPPRVTVIDAGTVGPFNFETISVRADDEDPASAAVEWLDENDYDLGAVGADVLRPYLEGGLNLIAFKLLKGKSAGSIRPVRLDYEARSMAIPLRPTAVAAQADMPILVWILGDERAVPTNYRTLELNELLIDWFNPGASYNRVVTAAANEAGGQGFVTEMAGSTGGLSSMIAPEFQAIENYYTSGDSLETNLVRLTNGLGALDGFADALGQHVQFRGGYTAVDFISCSSCYFDSSSSSSSGMGGGTSVEEPDPVFDTDILALVSEIEQGVLDPIRETAELFVIHDTVTRLYTTMSAKEMSKDPAFDFNPDMPDVQKDHVIDRVQSCEDDSWVARLSGGEKVYGQGNTWPHSLGETTLSANSRILQLSVAGNGEVIRDNSESIIDLHQSSPAGRDPSRAKGGCSYSSHERGDLIWLLGIAGTGISIMGRRRRFH